jgi:hypothetical protein
MSRYNILGYLGLVLLDSNCGSCPGTPTNFKAVQANPGDTFATLSWTATNTDGYTLKITDMDNASSLPLVELGKVETYFVSGLKTAVTYQFQLTPATSSASSECESNSVFTFLLI